MPSEVFLNVPGGARDPQQLMHDIETAIQPTIGDLLYAGQRQRSRILHRTERGVDVSEAPFHNYSTKGPFYYYPGKNAKSRAGAKSRFATKLGIDKKGTTKIKAGTGFTLRYGTSVVKKFTATRTTLGIKFSSYAAFKAALGRSNVDLRGPSAPHMLQAIIVRVAGFVLGIDDAASADNAQAADTIHIGIYGGAEAEKAEGHQTGAGHLPQRKFLGANDVDKTEVIRDIMLRAAARARKIIKGN